MELELTILEKKSELLKSYHLIQQLYPNMSEEEFSSHLDEMIKLNDFKMIAAFNQDIIVGVAGYWISRMLYCGKYLQVSSLAVDKNHRNLGIGKKLLEKAEEVAKKSDCNKLALDSYTENKKSHSLFHREDFYIRGFHFMKDIS